MRILRELVSVPSVSGREGNLRAIIREYIKDHVDEMWTDRMGNLIALKKGEGKGKVMLDAHMDQIGFLVSSITEEGLIKLTPVGGIFVPYVISQEVVILGKDPVEGVIQGIKRKKDENKFPELDSLYVDIGAGDKKEAEKYVEPGDVAHYKLKFRELVNRKLMGTAFDNKASVFLLIEAAKKLESLNYDIYFVFASQEEVGLRGTQTAAYSIHPDLALIFDVTYAWYPPFEKSEIPVELGKGPAVAVAPHINGKILSLILKVAEENKIPRQIEVAGRWTGTDTDYICISREGVPCGLISIPLRYMHSPCEVISSEDLENTLELTLKVLEEIQEVNAF